MARKTENLTPAQLADRCKRLMRPSRARPRGGSLVGVCREKGWNYKSVHATLRHNGLLPEVMAAKYEVLQ